MQNKPKIYNFFEIFILNKEEENWRKFGEK